MKGWVKGLLAGGLVLAVPVLGFVGVMVATFSGHKPLQTGEISDGVHAVEGGAGAATFIVEVNDGVVLVDAGMDAGAAAIRAKLAELDDPKVHALLLTHGHGDHVGGCAALIGAFPGIEVVAHEAEVALVQGEASAKGPLPRWMKNEPGCRVSRVVKHGAKVRYGEMDFEPYHLPGHTAGSVAWLGRRVLFLGDAATIETDGSMGGAMWVFSDDQAQANASLAALHAQLPPGAVRTLAPAHSGPAAGDKPLKAYSP